MYKKCYSCNGPTAKLQSASYDPYADPLCQSCRQRIDDKEAVRRSAIADIVAAHNAGTATAEQEAQFTALVNASIDWHGKD